MGGARYHRILVPLDGSPRAECVLPIATALAAQADALWLVHVVPSPTSSNACRSPPRTRRSWRRSSAATSSRPRSISPSSDAAPPAPHTHLLTNHNVDAMLHRFVAEHQIDLVLLSAHGCAGQAQWPFGSLTQSFIQYGETPLLIVQDMPLCASGAIQTALQSVVPTAHSERHGSCRAPARQPACWAYPSIWRPIPRKVKISERIDLTEVASPFPSTIGLSSAPLAPIIKADSR